MAPHVLVVFTLYEGYYIWHFRCKAFIKFLQDTTLFITVKFTMSAMASQITGASIVWSTVGSGADQRKHQSSASLAFVSGIHWWPVNSPHKRPVTRKMFSCDDVIMSATLIVAPVPPIRYSGKCLEHDIAMTWYNWLRIPFQQPIWGLVRWLLTLCGSMKGW